VLAAKGGALVPGALEVCLGGLGGAIGLVGATFGDGLLTVIEMNVRTWQGSERVKACRDYR
jgi:hypothetical protein